ncbi:cellulose synthase-like protein D5 [Lathyrus oleraceus]|uniref:Cellulose synthase-like protein D5 n=1 Tax=Pisum sativum TaxID=3888 RepID=A0A9D5AZN7_PEA|nr:cellulose synthase-like protein D5 [Pisum sativum]KAI5424956.1 Cellulose synthase-like protein D5 [Pisum sativum]
MVNTSSSSPVKITVSSGGKAGGSRRSIGLTSPQPRPSVSNNNNNNVNPNSPLTNRSNRLSTGISAGRRLSAGGNYSDATEETTTEYVSYTVHIPPTPDRMPLSSSQTSLPEENARNNPNYISGTIFTGGFNSVTRGHVIECSDNRDSQPLKSKLICGMKGCDEDAIKGCTCECGFKICRDCYKECCGNGNGYGNRGGGNKCPGCKEPYNNVSDSEQEEEEEEEVSECEDQALPLPSMAEFKLDKRLSLVKSFKAQNHPQDFDHTRWLFETKGTYGYGNAVWPKDGYGSNGYEPPPDFGKKSRRPLTRKVGVSAAILSPYRLLILMRLAALGLFLTWRIRHRNHEAMWLWGMSVTCELWFAFSWLLDQLPKLCPVNRVTDLAVLKDRFESPNLRNPKGRSDLPGIDVFVSTADPEKEPPLVTANTILSILAVDYPVEKVACYLSDDGGALLTFEALAETASFARVWVPFCKKHQIEPRNPEAYFGQKRDFLKNKVRLDFVRERRRVKREYDEFKVRINSLPESIRRRSDAYNAHEELRAKKKQMETGSDISDLIKVPRATWMSDGSHWPGTWPSAEPDHSRGDHAGIIQAMLAPPNVEPEYGTEADGDNLIDSTDVDIRLPMLVYVSREKRPGYDHNKKAGAMNALVRTSAIMSNGPFILNLDCDHYIYNSLAIREGMCFMLDRGGDRICYVQFPQRFEGIDPSDRYANHNTVFFDVSMRALDGLQGPMYVGTGCIFRRTALYGFSPPRASEHHGWFGRRKIKLFLRKPKVSKKEEDEVCVPINCDHNDDDADIESLLLPKRFGNSTSLAASIPVAEYQGRLLQDSKGNGTQGRPAGSLAVPREPLDAATVAEAISVISCYYEDKTEWGKRVGWIYGSVTEDVVTGYRMHNRGWRSVYCVTKRDAFRGTAPINLTDRLHQVLRWATGSVEIFFSRNNALLASPRMKFLQRVAYFNVGMYPFTSMFLIVYCFLPALSLFSGQFIVQSLSVTFLVFLLGITVTLCLLALLEIKWSGITLHDWWRNEQFWLIGGTSAHPAAVLQGLLKVVAGVDISFTLTSKSATPEDGEDEFADLYIVKWSFLMVPPITIMMVNTIAIAVGVARTLYSPFPQWSRLVGGLFFSIWVLCHLYPFAKGLLGRRGKVPTIIYVWSGLLSIIISLLWVYVHPPAGGRPQDFMNFQFP